MTTADDNVQRNLKLKITRKGIRMDSDDNKCDKVVRVIVKNGLRHQVESAGTEYPVVKYCAAFPSNTKKRSPETTLVGPKAKIRRMDRIVKLQCGNILRELMKHPYGWIFNVPVDPLKLNIPDYFSVISEPMDLGTIKHKLDGNRYCSMEEFAADVRLTFANAMLYNPPDHDAHKWAKLFNGNFNKKWKSLEAKLKGERITAANDDGQDSRQSVGKIVVDAIAGKVYPVKTLKIRSQCSGNNFQKENHSRSCTSANDNKIDSSAAKCPLCGGLICHCHENDTQDQAFSSDLSSGRSSQHKICGDSKMVITATVAKYPSTFETNQSGPDSDGPGAVDNGSPRLSTPSATASSGEGWTTLDLQLSPKKALRVAMLKSRFASTIYKATHQGEKTDPITMQQERERLEREQLEEKARIEKEIKDAEAAMRIKAQAELKMQREKEREAARIALQKIERTVEIYENQEILKELEMLCCSPDAVKNPLEQLLGLHMKDDDYVEEEEEEDEQDSVLDAEEGEIIF